MRHLWGIQIAREQRAFGLESFFLTLLGTGYLVKFYYQPSSMVITWLKDKTCTAQIYFRCPLPKEQRLSLL